METKVLDDDSEISNMKLTLVLCQKVIF